MLIKLKKNFTTVIIIFLSNSGFLNAHEYSEASPSSEKEILANEIFSKINNEHYYRNRDVKNFQKEQINELIDLLDPQKIYFTMREVSNLTNQQEHSYNDIDLKPLYKIINMYFKRLMKATNYQINVIKQGNFYLDANDNLDIFFDDNKWQKSILDLQKMWKKLVKNDLISSILSGKTKSESLVVLEKRYMNRLKRISQRNEEDVFSIAMNNLTNLYDPHSSYMSPKSAEDFEMAMILKLDGIGALLTTEDDYPLIVSLVPGGPAEKSGRIKPNDKIVKIHQVGSSSSPVDVVGWRIDEVVQLIRGKKGTKVELEIIPANSEGFGERKKVELIRDEVKLEEQAAKSKIFTINNNGLTKNLGIITLPTFYIDFNAWRMRDPNFRSSSNDVQDILKKFNQENVEGIIIDLRGNSGGSLYEVNKLVGLFTSSGATVQVKESSGQIKPWGDVRATQVWQKPMAVLVDRYSASASEIFAAAIQDYKRGIIIGHRTYGKGTVQKLDNLSKGQVKLTESKFYRLTGSGTQNKGILPDIVLPASWDINEIGESSLKKSLPWDEIKPIKFKEFQLPKDIYKKLNFAHLKRRANDPNMLYIANLKERYDNQKNKKSLSLNLKQRKNEKTERQRWALNIANDRLLKLGLEPFKTFKDLENFNDNKENEDLDIENDYLLKESLNILRDFIDIYQPLSMPEAA